MSHIKRTIDKDTIKSWFLMRDLVVPPWITSIVSRLLTFWRYTIIGNMICSMSGNIIPISLKTWWSCPCNKKTFQMNWSDTFTNVCNTAMLKLKKISKVGCKCVNTLFIKKINNNLILKHNCLYLTINNNFLGVNRLSLWRADITAMVETISVTRKNIWCQYWW